VRPSFPPDAFVALAAVPVVQKNARTRAAIANPALDVFLARGFSATRMGDVVDRAGCGQRNSRSLFSYERGDLRRRLSLRTTSESSIVFPGA
jgi:hypothetical protein